MSILQELWLLVPFSLRIIAIYIRRFTFIILYYFRGYSLQRLKQLVQLITSTSALPSILLGVVAILLTVFVWTKGPYSAFHGDSLYETAIKLINDNVVIYCILLCLFIALVGGRILFTKQTPEQYAVHSIEGRTISEQIRYISYLSLIHISEPTRRVVSRMPSSA